MAINMAPGQIEVFALWSFDQSVDEMAQVIRRESPEVVADVSDGDLRGRVRMAFEAADRFGIEDEEASAQLAVLVASIGSALLNAQEIVDLLSDTTLADHERVSSLVAAFEQT